MRRTVLAAVAMLAINVVDARAQVGTGTFTGFVTGHVGAITGGDLSDPGATLGASVAVHEETGWGAEIDFGHTSDVLAGRQILDVTSWMVNAVWVRPNGLIRPFGSGGAGVLQVNGCDAPCNIPARTFDFGLSVGGGTYVTFSDVAALRGDVRYFWASGDHPDLRRPDNFNYWRASFGVTFMWALAP
jgi:hypothetical protein